MFNFLGNSFVNEDHSNARRARLLNILLMGVAGITLLAGLFLTIAIISGNYSGGNPTILYVGMAILLGEIVLSFWLNRSGKVALASTLFLTMITLVFAFVDTPAEVVKGRTLFMFVIPVLMSSFLVWPYASFIATFAISALHIVIARVASVPDYNLFGVAAFVVIALVAWLAATNLEAALENLHKTNQELDQRVAERTKELADALEQLKWQTASLAMANEQLTKLDKLKSQFVSDVSHELRTPISNLAIYLEMMEAGNLEPKKQERYLKVLIDETNRLKNLVSDILDLARLEAGPSKIAFESVDLNEIANRVMLASQGRADAKGLQFSFTPAARAMVRGNADQLVQVVSNLVGNAINYTPAGSVQVRIWADDGRVRLSVQDTGFGIGETDLPHIFDRFYRGKNAGQSAIPGTGLGLAITKEILSSHQGTIEIQSAAGVGTTFTISLPAEA